MVSQLLGLANRQRSSLQTQMPTSPRIYVSTHVQIEHADLSLLDTHIRNQIAPNRFCGADNSALRIVAQSERDFDVAELNTANSVIEARPATPYYGENYERGDWPELCAIIEFLRARIPESRVWYGPDTSDDLTLVSRKWLDDMWEYWAYNGCRPYDDRSGRTKRWKRSRGSEGS